LVHELLATCARNADLCSQLFSMHSLLSRFHWLHLSLLSCLWAPLSGQAASIVLIPSKDNTLYESPGAPVSNGAGKAFFAGLTGINAEFVKRRALLQFDLSSIPSDALITGVSLTLFANQVSQAPTMPFMSLHRTLASWGEGNLSTELGSGLSAQPGDATWEARFFGPGGQNWTTPGGDFVPAGSATTRVGLANTFATWTSAGLTSDVQSWLSNPTTNFGWTLVGDEVTAFSAIRFVSREGTNMAQRPQLTITYEAVPEPSALISLSIGLLALASRRTRTASRSAAVL
jgi:hypothetical protein